MLEPSPGFVLLSTVSDLASARVLAARLESEGIEVRLHGESLGPYRLTVGDWALTELWVAGDRLDEARGVMLAAEVDAVLGEASGGAEEGRAAGAIPDEAGSRIPVGILMMIALVLVAALVGRLLVLLL
jgi:hypothetical protein